MCVPIPSDGPYEYWEPETMTGKGVLSMKHVAVACEIGQIGKIPTAIQQEDLIRLIVINAEVNVRCEMVFFEQMGSALE